jgi:isoaspartyl peptidase/L-asparaginase-like protein (Ntn-hydrolase superfamily)
LRLAALAVHGGAGRVEPGRLGAEEEVSIRSGLARALRGGWAVLSHGGSALDAVERAVAELEADPLFNAGLGSVLTAEGRVEADAAVMEGRERRAGAVACVGRIAHPVRLARRVMERTPHVLLVGAGAEAFARAEGFALVAPDSLVTERRRVQLERARAAGVVRLDLDGSDPADGTHPAAEPAVDPDTGGADPEATGTVGAVARDAAGHLAAATSTGGLTCQHPGRVGDTPLVGAGTWADDETCAVSATGAGEAFVRCAFAHEVDAALRWSAAHGRPLGLAPACEGALARVAALGASGGCIALGPCGAPVLAFNSPGMLRGAIGADGVPRVALYRGEILAPAPAQADRP